MANYYWSMESWGDAYPPENAEEIIDEANALIHAVEENDGEIDAEIFSETLWERYCSTGAIDCVIESGKPIVFSAAVELMDDDLREEIHADLAPCTNQEFFDEYIRRHVEKFGTEFSCI